MFKRILLAIFILSRGIFVWASCGANACPLDTLNSQKQQKESLTIDYSYQYIDQSNIYASADQAYVGKIKSHHDAVFTQSHIQTLRMQLGLLDRLSFDVALPFVQRQHQSIHNHHNDQLLQNWDIKGLGDIVILTRTTVWQNAQSQFVLTLGGKLPTGKTNARGSEQEEDGTLSSVLADVNLQPGSGSLDFIAGCDFLHIISAPSLKGKAESLPFFAQVQGRFTGKGTDDYRLGNFLTADGGMVYPLTDRLGFSLRSNLRYARMDDPGATGESIKNTGGIWLYATPGLTLKCTDKMQLYMHVQVPVYQNVNGIQPVSAYNLILGATCRL